MIEPVILTDLKEIANLLDIRLPKLDPKQFDFKNPLMKSESKKSSVMKENTYPEQIEGISCTWKEEMCYLKINLPPSLMSKFIIENKDEILKYCQSKNDKYEVNVTSKLNSNQVCAKKGYEKDLAIFLNSLLRGFRAKNDYISYPLQGSRAHAIISDGLDVQDLILSEEFLKISLKFNSPIKPENIYSIISIDPKNVKSLEIIDFENHLYFELEFFDKKVAKKSYEHIKCTSFAIVHPIYEHIKQYRLYEFKVLQLKFLGNVNLVKELNLVFKNLDDLEKARLINYESSFSQNAKHIITSDTNKFSLSISSGSGTLDKKEILSKLNESHVYPVNIAIKTEPEIKEEIERTLNSLSPVNIIKIHMVKNEIGDSVARIIFLNEEEIETILSLNKDITINEMTVKQELRQFSVYKIDKILFNLVEPLVITNYNTSKLVDSNFEMNIDKKIREDFVLLSFSTTDKDLFIDENDFFKELLEGEDVVIQEKSMLYSKEMKKFYEELMKIHVNLKIIVSLDPLRVKVYSSSSEIISEVIKKIESQIELEKKEAKEIVDLSLYTLSLIQEYLKSLNSDDIRLTVMNGKGIIRGKIEVVKQFMEKIESFPKKDAIDDSEKCLICFELMGEDAITLKNCQHKYCSSCLELMIASFVSTSAMNISCPQCSEKITLEEIKTFGTEYDISQGIEKSVRGFLLRNSDKYKFCPDPQCQEYFQYTFGMETNKCTKCNVNYCVRNPLDIHRDHPDKACEVYKVDLQYQINDTDIKRLKCCNNAVEKLIGCNHITCICKKHSCWVCLKIFSIEKEVYAHLNQEHGGIHNLDEIEFVD